MNPPYFAVPFSEESPQRFAPYVGQDDVAERDNVWCRAIEVALARSLSLEDERERLDERQEETLKALEAANGSLLRRTLELLPGIRKMPDQEYKRLCDALHGSRYHAVVEALDALRAGPDLETEKRKARNAFLLGKGRLKSGPSVAAVALESRARETIETALTAVRKLERSRQEQASRLQRLAEIAQAVDQWRDDPHGRRLARSPEIYRRRSF